jgi:Hsp70 protein
MHVSPNEHRDRDHDGQRLDISQQRRHYHATPRNEILPLLAVGAVVTISYYSYRSWQRMQAEYEDYQYEKHQYERWLALNSDDSSTDPKIISLAIDLGTSFTKIASTTKGGTKPTNNSGADENNKKSVEVMITREGDRSFFNGIIYDGENCITGRSALERYSFAGGSGEHAPVRLPFLSLTSGDSQQLITDVLRDPVREVWERLQQTTSPSQEEDEEQGSAMMKRQKRIIVTVPTFFLQHPKVFQTAFAKVSMIDNDDSNRSAATVFVPEPVAAVWGAQMMHDASRLPELAKTDSVLVVDVGGWTTQISVVQNHRVTGSTTLAWGGEVAVEHCAKLLQKLAPADQPMTDARAQAMLQWHARMAVHEMSKQTRVDVHIPYVFADPQRHHLDAQLARSVLEEVLDDHVSTCVDVASLSPSLPKPTDLKSWFTSAVTRVLEDVRVMPTNLKACLLVGGASRIPLVQRSLESTLHMLLGPVFLDTIAVVPPFHHRSTASSRSTAHHQHPAEEWTVLGAATLAPSFGYSIPDGLVMNDKS